MRFKKEMSLSASIFILCIGGWIANILKLFSILDGGLTAMFFARLVGVFVAPMGVLLGFF